MPPTSVPLRALMSSTSYPSKQTEWKGLSIPVVSRLTDAKLGNHNAGERVRVWAKCEIGTWDDCAERHARIHRQLREDVSK
jgi:hypothetical protein